jgi:hypothetical protein
MMEAEILQLLVGLVGGAGGAGGVLKWVMNGSKKRLENIETVTGLTNTTVNRMDRKLLVLEVRHNHLEGDVDELKSDFKELHHG